MKPKMELEKEPSISLASVNEGNRMQLKKLNDVLFPFRFNQEFYDQALASGYGGDFTKLAFYGDYCVGAILCDLKKEDDGVSRVQVLSFGVLGLYRRKGIGTMLINHVLDRCSKENVSEIYLHVNTENEDAINYCKKKGFEMTETIKNYYKNTPYSPDSYKFTKIIVANQTKKRPFSEVNTKEETLGSCSDMGDSSHRKKVEVKDEASISLVSVTDKNLMQLKKLSNFPYGDDHYADSLASGDFTKLALCDDDYVGAIECGLEKKYDGTVARVYVINLVVKETFRRRGIGTKLMNHVIDCCSKEKVPEVYLHVSTANEDAIKFYEKFGFEKTSTVQGSCENSNSPLANLLLRIETLTYQTKK